MVRRQGVRACPCVNTPLTVCAQRWCLPPCGLGNPSLAGAVCVNFFANELCADTLGRRVRRKGHGMTAVCMAVKATMPAPPMEFLNDESAIDEFGLTFVSEEEAGQLLVGRCAEDFTDLAGAVAAARAESEAEDTCAPLKGKTCRQDKSCTFVNKQCISRGRRSRRASHMVPCVNFFANEACADTFGRRVRRKGHGMTAVCMHLKETMPPVADDTTTTHAAWANHGEVSPPTMPERSTNAAASLLCRLPTTRLHAPPAAGALRRATVPPLLWPSRGSFWLERRLPKV